MEEEKQNQRKEFFNDPKNYLNSNVIIELRKKIIRDYLGNITNKSLIDIGCGNGELTKEYAGNNKITFLDVSPNMISLAKSNILPKHLINCDFHIGDINSFKTEQKYDIIVCVGVLAHIESLKTLLSKLKELSKEDCTIILQYTANEKIIAKFNKIRSSLFKTNSYNYPINYTTTNEVESSIKTNGLKIVSKTNYIPISPLLSLFNYKIKKMILSKLIYSKVFRIIGSEVIVVLTKKQN